MDERDDYEIILEDLEEEVNCTAGTVGISTEHACNTLFQYLNRLCAEVRCSLFIFL